MKGHIHTYLKGLECRVEVVYGLAFLLEQLYPLGIDVWLSQLLRLEVVFQEALQVFPGFNLLLGALIEAYFLFVTPVKGGVYKIQLLVFILYKTGAEFNFAVRNPVIKIAEVFLRVGSLGLGFSQRVSIAYFAFIILSLYRLGF